MDGAGGQNDLAPVTGPSRSQVLRDLVVFQGKLFLDGLRDLVLSPVSLVAGLISVFRRDPKGRDLFYRTVRFGHRTERWIDLFEAAKRDSAAPPGSDNNPPDAGLDDIVSRVESMLREEYRAGGVSAAARQTLGKALEHLRHRRD